MYALARVVFDRQKELMGLAPVKKWLAEVNRGPVTPITGLQVAADVNGRMYFLCGWTSSLSFKPKPVNYLTDSLVYIASWSYARMLGCCAYGHLAAFNTYHNCGLASWLWPELEKAAYADGYAGVFGTTATSETGPAMIHLLEKYGWERLGKEFLNTRTRHMITTWRKLLNADTAGKRVVA